MKQLFPVKKSVAVAIGLLLGSGSPWSAPTSAHGEEPPVSGVDIRGMINVKNFSLAASGIPNAKGDGRTDDTAALQAAANLADNKRFSVRPNEPGAVYVGASPTLYFPAGHYVVSKEIYLGAYANIVSDGKAIIEQKTTGQRIFVFNDGYTVSIRGIKFLRGSNQLYLSNKNTDGTMIEIRDCEFHYSSDYAINTEGTFSATDNHMSANMVIDHCKFINPRKVLRNVCDYAMIRDSWIGLDLRNFDADSAAFLQLSGVMMFDNMIGVPSFGLHDATGEQTLNNNGITNVRWVDNYASFMVSRSRFGGEFGGIPIVHSFSTPHPAFPWMGPTISIEDSWICAGPGVDRPDSGVITLRRGIPQSIRIVGNKWLVNSPYIRNNGVDIPAFLGQFPNAKERFKIVIEPNMAYPTAPRIPPELEPYVYKG
jgi:hypothetical protein